MKEDNIPTEAIINIKMTTGVSVDDEWRVFLNSQANGLDITSRMFINSQWSEPNKINTTVYTVDMSHTELITNKIKTLKISPKKSKSSAPIATTLTPGLSPDKNVSTAITSELSADKILKQTQNVHTPRTKYHDDENSDTETETDTVSISHSDSDSDSDDTEDSIPQNQDNTANVVVEQVSELEEEEQAMASNTLYISTKTKVLFLNQTMDLNTLFWSIPITEYWQPVECVVKKQMKIVSNTPEEYQELVEKLKTVPYYTEHVIKQIDNPNARRIKFKDERKITIGVSKKDIMNYRCKVKNAFYNCFAIIIRFKYQNAFKEIHVKVFNTGKLEIPGVLNKEILDIVSQKIVDVLQPFVSKPLGYVEETQEENVLINSNFNCGYYINREELFNILRAEPYGIETSYDPCIYPGIKCKFYFNNEIGTDREKQTGNFAMEERNMKKQQLLDSKKYTEVSFMIFRTGSCLIVGNCPEKTLLFVFEYIRDILIEQCDRICVKRDDTPVKGKKPKQRKKNVSITSNYYTKIINANV
jgi:hypothetical protein